MMQPALDLIDRAFIGRLQGQAVDLPQSPPCGAGLAALQEDVASPPGAVAVACPDAVPVPEAWEAIADEMAAAAAAGCRVIAVVATRRGEGCSTVAQGAARALRSRGRPAACVTRPPLQVATRNADADAADVVVVDAGNWFPPGPIRRSHVARQAFGCDAAILVRRARRPACTAHAEALAAIGLRVLGEVETFADDAASEARESTDA